MLETDLLEFLDLVEEASTRYLHLPALYLNLCSFASFVDDINSKSLIPAELLNVFEVEEALQLSVHCEELKMLADNDFLRNSSLLRYVHCLLKKSIHGFCEPACCLKKSRS